MATGLVAWEETPPDKRDQIPQALRLGMSRMYAAAALSGKPVPTTLPEFFKKLPVQLNLGGSLPKLCQLFLTTQL